MTRDILVPIDGSDPSWQALEFALEQHPDADVTAFNVVNTMAAADTTALSGTPAYQHELFEAQEERAEELLAEAEERAAEYDADVDTEYVRGLPRESILDFAEDDSVDQIVIGSHGRSGVERILLGSVAEKVLRHSSVPVTIVHPSEE